MIALLPGILGLIYLAIMAALVYAWKRIAREPACPGSSPPISVLIAAHNEADNLATHLESWLSQQYAEYEVVLILDRCEDASEQIIRTHQQVFPHLRYLTIAAVPEGWAPKKWALQQGIEAASHEHLVFTDADCSCPPNWLATMTGKWSGNALVLGVGPYRWYPGLLNALIQLETHYTALQYIGFAWWGLPYMAVGRNLAYTRAFFRQNGGFSKFQHRLSGDDDLLVNAYAQASNTTLQNSFRAAPLSEPKRIWRDWIQQKLRHLSASPAYSLRSKAVLGLFHFSHLAVYLSGFLYFFPGITNPWLLYVFFGRLLGAWLLWGMISSSLSQRTWVLAFPILDFLFFLYNLIAVPIGLYIQPTWTKNTKSPKIPKRTGV